MLIVRELAALAVVCAALTAASPAFAQTTRTWVSGVGDDANPCSRTAPCLTFQGALAKTAVGGEIDCLDPGDFGSLELDQAVTIDCSAATGFVSGFAGFHIAAPAGAFIHLIGLEFIGAGGAQPGPAVVGIEVSSGDVLISRSVFHGYHGPFGCGSVSPTYGAGVCVAGPTGTKLVIEDSVFRDNGYGVVNSPVSGANTVVIEHSVLDGATIANLQNGPGAGAKTYLNGDSLINCPTAVAGADGTVFTYGNNTMTGSVATLTPTPSR